MIKEKEIAIPLTQIETGYSLAKHRAVKVNGIKRRIRESPDLELPTLPVMFQGEEWNVSDAETSKYYLLAGESLLQAMGDLSSDERFVLFSQLQCQWI